MNKATTTLLLLLSCLLLSPTILWAGPAPLAPQGYSSTKLPPLIPSDPQKAVSAWLIKNLPEPDAYEALDWSQPVYMPYGWHFNWAIRHLYIYQHHELGKVIADDIFYFDGDGYVAGRTNTSIWRNQAMDVPDWGWGWEKWGPEGKQPLREEWDRIRDDIGY